MQSERATLILSSSVALLMGVLAIGFALATNSRAILLDGVFNLIYFGAGLATVRIERLLREPDNPRFPFGHGYFESFVNAGKGLMILGISLIALADSAIALLTDGRSIAAGLAIGYALLATGLCSGTAFLLRRRSDGLDSPLVRADAENWTLNAAVSAVVLVGFCLGPVFPVLGWSAAAPYIDPVLVAAVVLVFLGVPVRMARTAILELLNRAPDPGVEQPVTAAIDQALADLPVRERQVRMVRPGRTLYVLVHVVLAREHPLEGLDTLDALRADIDAAVRRVHPRVMTDVLFTADPRWAAPGTGLLPPVDLAERG